MTRWAAGAAGVLAAATILGSVGALPARGQVVASPVYRPIAGPVLAGASAVWVEDSPDGGVDLQMAGPGQPVVTVEHFPQPQSNDPNGRTYEAWVAASSSRLALQLSFGSYTVGFSEQILSGPIGSSLTPTSPDCNLTTAPQYRIVSVSEQALTTTSDAQCSQFVVTDFGGGGPVSVPLAEAAGFPRVAGDYAAFGHAYTSTPSPPALEVDAWRTQQMVYSIPAEELPGQLQLKGLDLNSDGTLLVDYWPLRPGVERDGVAWASAREPWLHRLLAPYGQREAQLDGDRAIVLTTHQTSDFGTLTAVALDTGRSKVLTHKAARADLNDFAVSDGRIAWMSTGCAHANIVISSTAGPLAAPDTRHCRFVGPRIVRRVTEHHLRLGVSCAGFRKSCQVADASLWARDRTGRYRTLVGRQPAETSGNAGSFGIRLTKAGIRLLGRPPGRKLRLVGYIGNNPTPHPHRRPSDAQRRVGTFSVY